MCEALVAQELRFLRDGPPPGALAHHLLPMEVVGDHAHGVEAAVRGIHRHAAPERLLPVNMGALGAHLRAARRGRQQRQHSHVVVAVDFLLLHCRGPALPQVGVLFLGQYRMPPLAFRQADDTATQGDLLVGQAEEFADQLRAGAQAQ